MDNWDASRDRWIGYQHAVLFEKPFHCLNFLWYEFQTDTQLVSKSKCATAIQLIAYPLGLGWDLIFPDHEFNVFGLKFNLKPGKFNIKEHTIIVVMANAGYANGAIYATDVLVSQMVFYGQNFG